VGKPNRQGLERQIPELVAREVRQRCKFCCVICGEALVELHHFAPEFVHASKHEADGITLLCGTHHAAATRGHLPPIDVSEADAARRQDAAFQGGAYLLRLRAPAQLAIGPMIFLGEGKLLEICGTTILRLDSDAEGRVWLSGNLFDDRGAASMAIKNNVIVLKPENWDVQIEGPIIRIRSRQGRIAMEMRIMPPHVVHVSRLTLQHANWTLDADAWHLKLDSQMGGGFDVEDTAIITGGTTSLISGGSVLEKITFDSAYSGDRLDAFARRGMLASIINEIRLGTIVRVEQSVKHGLVGWLVTSHSGMEDSRRKFHGVFLTETGAVGRARRVAAAAIHGRVVVHRLEGKRSLWFANPLPADVAKIA
jgi:hypothetical protein